MSWYLTNFLFSWRKSKGIKCWGSVEKHWEKSRQWSKIKESPTVSKVAFNLQHISVYDQIESSDSTNNQI